ncbi:MAG TPA: hypothetical protein VLH56_13165 [Dissulfurispiraceae bacterium]|nr:hypothetical protein [Dissulfurispiraceae bacterium]
MRSPKVQPAPVPPPPPSYISYSYDDDGNPIIDQQQIFDAATNTYKYIPRELSAQEKDERKEISAMRSAALENFKNIASLTPEQQDAKYAEYSSAYKSAALREFNPIYEKTARDIDEQAAARGMMGSRAYVDTLAELNDSRTKREMEVAEDATLLGRNLYREDVDRAGNLYTGLKGLTRADDAYALQKQSAAAGIHSGYEAAQQARHNSALSAWATQQEIASRNASAKAGMLGSIGMGLGYLLGGPLGGLFSGAKAGKGAIKMAGSFNSYG